MKKFLIKKAAGKKVNTCGRKITAYRFFGEESYSYALPVNTMKGENLSQQQLLKEFAWLHGFDEIPEKYRKIGRTTAKGKTGIIEIEI